MERSAAPTAPTQAWWVVCLCAAWCNTCTDYRPIFLAGARDWPQMRFEWVDIEDESELAGDLDVETFPTLLIADAHKARFLGPLLPHAAVLSRLIGSLRDAGPAAEAQVDPEAQALFSRVRSARA